MIGHSGITALTKGSQLNHQEAGHWLKNVKVLRPIVRTRSMANRTNCVFFQVSDWASIIHARLSNLSHQDEITHSPVLCQTSSKRMSDYSTCLAFYRSCFSSSSKRLEIVYAWPHESLIHTAIANWFACDDLEYDFDLQSIPSLFPFAKKSRKNFIEVCSPFAISRVRFVS